MMSGQGYIHLDGLGCYDRHNLNSSPVTDQLRRPMREGEPRTGQGRVATGQGPRRCVVTGRGRSVDGVVEDCSR
jgi:hypothetical protein